MLEIIWILEYSMGVNHTNGSILVQCVLPACTSPSFTSIMDLQEMDGMDLFLRKKHDIQLCALLQRHLCFSWLAGLISGAGASVLAGDTLVSAMRAASSGCVSISGLLSVLLLPLLFSALAVYICQIRLLFPIAFVKAFCFSFAAMAVDRAFGSAGWLVRLLLLFGSGASLPVLWWFWVRLITSRQNHILGDFVAAMTAISVIACFDHWIIAPFLTDLIS